MSKKVYISSLKIDHLQLSDLMLQLVVAERVREIAERRRYYSRILTRVDNQLRGFQLLVKENDIDTCPGGMFSSLYYEMLDFKWLNEKRILLEQLVRLSISLVHNYDEKDDLRFQQIQLQLEGYLDAVDRRLGWTRISQLLPCSEDYLLVKAQDKVRIIRSQVRDIKRKIYRQPVRDIRQFLRNVIRLMFRSAGDDDADVANVFVVNVFEKSLVTSLKHYQNEQERDFRAAIRA